MGALSKYGWRIIFALVVIFGGGWVLAFAANLTAFVVSPQMIARFQCPAGSTVKQTWHTPYPGAGFQNELTDCIGPGGNVVPMLPDDQTTAAEYRFFYPPSVLVMAIGFVGRSIYSARSRTAQPA